MQFLLNSLHTTNGGTSSSDCQCVVHRTFYGRLQSIVTCDKCSNKTTTRDPFLDLSLDVRPQKKKLNGESKTDDSGGLRLEDCLKRFTSKEKLAAAEYTCTKCATQRDAIKQFSVLSLPPVLCIHLKVSKSRRLCLLQLLRPHSAFLMPRTNPPKSRLQSSSLYLSTCSHTRPFT